MMALPSSATTSAMLMPANVAIVAVGMLRSYVYPNSVLTLGKLAGTRSWKEGRKEYPEGRNTRTGLDTGSNLQKLKIPEICSGPTQEKLEARTGVAWRGYCGVDNGSSYKD